MEFPRIALKVGQKQFNKLIDTANKVENDLNGNLNFTVVSPPLVSLNTVSAEVTAALAKWGQKGSRGSHADYVDLCTKAQNLHLILKELAQYVANTAEQAAGTDYSLMASIMTTSGF